MLETARRRAVLAAFGGGLLLAGVGVGAAAVTGEPPATREVSEVAPVTTSPTAEPSAATEAPEPSTSTSAPAPAPAPETQAADAPAATVDDVTSPEPAPEPVVEPDPEPVVDPEPVPDPAERTAGGIPADPPEMPKLPGEDGYVAPDGREGAPPAEQD